MKTFITECFSCYLSADLFFSILGFAWEIQKTKPSCPLRLPKLSSSAVMPTPTSLNLMWMEMWCIYYLHPPVPHLTLFSVIIISLSRWYFLLAAKEDALSYSGIKSRDDPQVIMKQDGTLDFKRWVLHALILQAMFVNRIDKGKGARVRRRYIYTSGAAKHTSRRGSQCGM